MVSGEFEKMKGVIFRFASSHSAKESSNFLKEFSGVLVTDGYEAYKGVEGVTHAECWAHARRYFYESVPLDSHKKMLVTAEGYKGIELIDALFDVEREITSFSVEEKLNVRREKSEPILEFFNTPFC